MMDAHYKELIQFLRDKNPQVRQIALANLLPQTAKGSPHRDVFFAGLRAGGLQKPRESDVIRDLKLLCRDQLATAHDAFRALINLSDSSVIITHLSDVAFLTYVVSYIINPQSILADLASMLLSNLTSTSAACSILVSLKVSVLPVSSSPSGIFATQGRSGTCAAPVPYPAGEPQAVLALPLLVDAFVHGAQVNTDEDVSKRQRKGELHFLASVFANITTSQPGRLFFLDPRTSTLSKSLEYPLAKLVPFTEHKDTIRRGGVISAIKNCAFYVAGHRAVLSSESEEVAIPPSKVSAHGVDVLPYILLPLAGPEELDLEDQERLPPSLQFLPPDKKREPDEVLRLTLVETLLLLCTTRWGREYLREHGAYEIVRETHASEKVDKIAEHIERLVNLLKRDEGVEIEEVEEIVEQQNTDERHPSVREPDDDEDNQIEEI